MYMTSLTACQKSKLSIGEALAVGTESEAPALGLGRIWSHRLGIGGYCLIACYFFCLVQAGRLDPPYQFEWSVFISWIMVATAIAELESGLSASPVLRDPRAFRRFSHSQPLFSEYRQNSHICHLRDFGSWRTSSDAPTSFLEQALVHEIYL